MHERVYFLDNSKFRCTKLQRNFCYLNHKIFIYSCFWKLAQQREGVTWKNSKISGLSNYLNVRKKNISRHQARNARVSLIDSLFLLYRQKRSNLVGILAVTSVGVESLVIFKSDGQFCSFFCFVCSIINIIKQKF